MNYKRFENESDEELIYRICSEKETIGSWQDVADILNKLLNQEYTESKYRKQFQAFQKMLSANQSKFVDSSAQIEEIKDLTRRLKREQVKFRDERNAWNKQNYIDARIEQKLNYLEEQLSDLGKEIFEPHIISETDGDSDLIICLSDLHIGETFSNAFGKYNSDIAKKRLDEYLEKIVRIGSRHKIKNVYLVGLGDMLSGSIHLSIQVNNRENVIEQIKLASRYIGSFAYELSKHFNHVYFSSVAGNHSRLVSNKELDNKDERLDDLISWIVEQTTLHIDNITVLHDKFDNTVSKIVVRDKSYILCHGDYDAPSQNSIGKLCMMIGEFPYCIIAGHKHTPMSNEFNGIKFIQSGSLAGSGDSYTVQKRLSGKPNQTVLVCDKDGIECIYNIELN